MKNNDNLNKALLKQQVNDIRKEHQMTINKLEDTLHILLKRYETTEITDEEIIHFKNANDKILRNIKDIMEVEVECIQQKEMPSYMRLENIKAQYINLMSIIENIIY